MKKAIQIVLAIVIIVLGYLVVESVLKPIRFNKELEKRYSVTQKRMVDIRTAQVAYNTEHGNYTGSFDELIDFVKNDSFKVVNKKGTLTEDLIEDGWTEQKALEAGLIDRDTIRISVKDSLFKKSYPIDSIRFVPFTSGAQFEMAAGKVETGSKVTVQVFELKVHNDILLHGMNRQLVVNFNDEREKFAGYPGLQIGSLTEATNNAANW